MTRIPRPSPLVAACCVALSAAALASTAAAAPQRPAPAAPVAAAASPPATGPFAWLAPAAAGLAREADWSPADVSDLHRDATRGELDDALAALGGRPVHRGADPAAPVTVRAAHLLFVRALGLERERRALNALATDDGARLRVSRHFGSEVLARELGLVANHPSAHDGLERAGAERLRMADLVHMAGEARDLSSWDLDRARAFRGISLPAMSPARRAVVQAALAQVGRPYVWGGDWPGRNSPWGLQASGGFDCSGLVWWAYKGARTTRSLPAGAQLRGRTADDMAFESPRQRIPAGAARAGDLVFFGPAGARSARGSISHVGIALGGGWIIHSAGSRGGPTISHLDRYWTSGTAFGRALTGLG